MLPQLRLSQSSTPYSVGRVDTRPKTVFDFTLGPLSAVGLGVKRRWLRERRRRKVGRAYDMALEIARVVPRGSEVLDVGCGNGYIAHHLSALLGRAVTGIDVADSTEAPIDYRQYDGREFPAANASFDAVVLAYVLHHAQDVRAMLNEMKRALRPGGVAIIYEDIPETLWDRFICWTHNLKWRKRTGTCTFRSESEWRAVFEVSGFEVIHDRQLSRLRNLMHPVCRRFYLLERTDGKG
jgi:ubiquinone/menaquinone biosynthesis C-methylase UbiE